MRGLGAALGAVGVLIFGISAFGAASAAAPATPPEPKVTVIGDSVMTGILWYRDATEILEQDLALRMEVAVCRRLTGTSCTFEGVTPPNLVQLSQSLGRQLGPTVLVEMGYNDREVTFAQSLEASINALLRAGVTRIVWANLREARLHASGGKAPYRYRLAVGQLPKGLTLRAAGLITGTPVRSARVELTLRVSDAGGRAAVRADPLEIKG